MAEEKKDAKKEAPKPSTGVSWEEVMLLILGIIALLFVFLPRIFPQEGTGTGLTQAVGEQQQTKPFNIKDTYNRIFSSRQETITDNQGQVVGVVQKPSLIDEGKSRFSDFLQNAAMIAFSILIFFTLLFSVIIYYNKFRKELIVNNYKKKFLAEDKNLDEKNDKILETMAPDTNGIVNPRWQVIGKYYNSANQSDWKLAILEADIMLYEVLNKSGFPGTTIGEMLKNTDRSKLQTLDAAWSAHKIRNEIAHQGLDYVLNRSMVEKAISEYEQVFEELNFI